MTDTDDKPVLLVVDDQPENIHLIGDILGEKYTVLAATNGEKALKIAEQNPDLRLVLMDVMMPGMDGYEVTRRLKDNFETSHLVVIFVSALDSVENIVSGYEAGGADYLVKPIQPDELSRKVELVFENERQRNALQAEKAMAMDTAMTAMVAGGEQGVLLDFMRQSFNVKSVEALAKQVVDSCAGYDLNVSVQFRSEQQNYNAARDEPMSPMEEMFLSKVKNAGRLREKGKHFVANFGDITLLVKDMPEDEEKRGRLRDHLAILLEGLKYALKTCLYRMV